MTSKPQQHPNVPLSADDSGRLFKLMIDLVVDYAIFLLDPEGRITTWNPGAHRLKQYLPEEIIGKHFSIFYTKPDLDIRKPWHELEVASKVGRFEDEGWRLRKDGSRFWANVIIVAVRDHEGTLLGFGKITRDLTERREAEQRYRLLVEGVTDYAIYSLDPDGNVTGWNSGAQRIKGYSSSEIIGKHFSSFYTPEDREAQLPAHVLKTAAAEGHFEGEGWRVRKDGTRFWSNVVVTPIHDEEGVLRGYSKITRDITDRKLLLDEVRRHAAVLEAEVKERERTNAELEAFSYSVSHDLRAPLRAIEGFSSALREDFGAQLPPEAIDYLNEIGNASIRMNRLVQDLLEYGRLSRLEMQLVDVSVSDAVEEALKELGADRSAVTIDIPKPLCAVAHRVTLVQVLANLLSNAMKFRDKSRELTVRVSAAGDTDEVVIKIEDTGIGIPAPYFEKIFKVFERLHGHEEFPGTGIGLAIVQRGVERMGGRIVVTSESGVGSTFAVHLPAPRRDRRPR